MHGKQNAYDEIQEYIDETVYSDGVRTEIIRLFRLLQRCQGMPFNYQSVFAKWLRDCRKEVCMIEDSFDPVLIRKNLLNELEAFERWILPFVATEKMAVPQQPLRLRTFIHHSDDTDKTVAIEKI